MRYVVAAIAIISFVLMASNCAIAAEDKGTCDNPIKETIDKTSTIKAQQPKPFASKGKSFDILGNSRPTETDNSGKIN
jgi:hypothetical protein